MNLAFLDHLEIKAYRVELRLDDPIQCHFFHGPALNGLLCSVLNRHPVGPEIALFPVESGRVEYGQGQMYNFGVILFGHFSDLAGQIEAGLRALGARPRKSKTFGRFEVLAFESVALPIDELPQTNEVMLQLVTPLRMERQDGTKGRRFLAPDCFSPERFFRLFHDRVYDLCKLSSKPPPPYEIPELPETEVLKTALIWVDAPYHGHRKTFGGVVGSVHFKGDLPTEWRRLLWTGQYVGAGRNTAFGFGQYRLAPEPSDLAMKKSRTFLELAISPENMVEAFGHIKLNPGMPGSDRESIDAFAKDLLVNLNDLAHSLHVGTYRPQPLAGMVLPKPKGSGKIRALAIPTVRDRIVQRSVTQILEPSFDLLLEESSFAFRKGFSRVGVAQAIAQAYEQGYRYILELDIESFFDNVDWLLLEDKLRALLYNDPIVDLIMDWVTQEVIFEGQTIKRTHGLPQGAAISPMLSKLYLDEFDESLQEGFRLIRYCDHFAVLCKSKEQAQQAQDKAMEALGRLELETKPAKTHMSDFDRGFQHLAYIFCQAMIVEVQKDQGRSSAISLKGLSPEQIPPNHWLTHCNLKIAKAIKPLSRNTREKKRRSGRDQK